MCFKNKIKFALIQKMTTPFSYTHEVGESASNCAKQLVYNSGYVIYECVKDIYREIDFKEFYSFPGEI